MAPPTSPSSVYPAASVTITRGAPQTFTLKRNPRFFCSACGTRLFIDVLPLKVRGVNSYLLPQEHSAPNFICNASTLFAAVLDDLPHFRSRPKRFGGSDETMPW